MCFRLVGSDVLNETFLRNINASGALHMVPATVGGKYIIRFGVNAPNITKEDIGSFQQTFFQAKLALINKIPKKSFLLKINRGESLRDLQRTYYGSRKSCLISYLRWRQKNWNKWFHISFGWSVIQERVKLSFMVQKQKKLRKRQRKLLSPGKLIENTLRFVIY